MGSKLPIDDWAEELHPSFLENVKCELNFYFGKNPHVTEDDLYYVCRHIMMYARQEFEA